LRPTLRCRRRIINRGHCLWPWGPRAWLSDCLTDYFGPQSLFELVGERPRSQRGLLVPPVTCRKDENIMRKLFGDHATPVMKWKSSGIVSPHYNPDWYSFVLDGFCRRNSQSTHSRHFEGSRRRFLWVSSSASTIFATSCTWYTVSMKARYAGGCSPRPRISIQENPGCGAAL